MIREYFARQGAHCPPDANPAEYMLEAIGAGSKRRVGDKDWADRWVESQEFEQVKREIEEINRDAMSKEDAVDPEASKTYATPFFTQLRIVSARTTKAFYRQPDYEFTRLFNHISISLFTSLTFLMLGNNLVTLQYRVFDIFIAASLISYLLWCFSGSTLTLSCPLPPPSPATPPRPALHPKRYYMPHRPFCQPSSSLRVCVWPR